LRPVAAARQLIDGIFAGRAPLAVERRQARELIPRGLGGVRDGSRPLRRKPAQISIGGFYRIGAAVARVQLGRVGSCGGAGETEAVRQHRRLGVERRYGARQLGDVSDGGRQRLALGAPRRGAARA
jgi:hypothetical protein